MPTVRKNQVPAECWEKLQAAAGIIPAAERVERVTLPLPPSANNLFANAPGKGRVKSREYRDWLDAVGPIVRTLRSPAKLPCVFLYLIRGKVFQQRDGFNLEKPLLDACVSAGVIPDDSLKYVRSGHWLYEPGAGPPQVVVWFEPLGEA